MCCTAQTGAKEDDTTTCWHRMNSDLYCLQWATENNWMELVKRKGVVFHHDDVNSYTYLAIRQEA